MWPAKVKTKKVREKKNTLIFKLKLGNNDLYQLNERLKLEQREKNTIFSSESVMFSDINVGVLIIFTRYVMTIETIINDKRNQIIRIFRKNVSHLLKGCPCSRRYFAIPSLRIQHVSGFWPFVSSLLQKDNYFNFFGICYHT